MPSIRDVAFKIDVRGLPELQAKLRRLGDKMEQRIMRRALAAGAAVIREEIRRRVPIRTGALRKAIISYASMPQRGLVVARVKVDPKRFGAVFPMRGGVTAHRLAKKSRYIRGIRGSIIPAYYAHLVEFGTKPHQQAKRKVKHPGARPKPFFRPGIEAGKDGAAKAILETIRQGIAEAVKR